MNALTDTNMDQGIKTVAPGIISQETELDANVICLARQGDAIIAGLGDGQVVALTGGQVVQLAQHTGAVMSLVATRDGAIYSAGQDGVVMSAALGRGATPVFRSDKDWITEITLSPDQKRLAIAVGARIVVMEADQVVARYDDHPSTVSGVRFLNNGKQIAASRYNGVSLWSVEELRAPVELRWAGSLTGLSVSPNDQYIAAATQDRELHVWDLVSGRDFRLGGYQRKVKAFGWTGDSTYLYTSGADVLVAWGLAGDPGAIPPVEIGYAFSQTVSAVAETGSPLRMAAGYTDGSLMVGEVQKASAKIARPGGGGAVTAILADDTLSDFAFGTAGGIVGRVAIEDVAKTAMASA